MDRRGFIAAGAGAASTAFAGCLGALEAAPAASDSIRLPSVDAAGSPGGKVAIRPPGKVVLLDFFATWCAPCKPEMANLRAARERFDRGEVFIVSITQETDAGAIRRFWRRYRGAWPAAMDPDLAATRAYDVSAIPTIIVLTADGEEVMRHTGLAGKGRIVSNIERALREG